MYTLSHICGGTILSTGGTGEQDHHYCDRCRAFIYAPDGGPDDVPSGTDEDANRAAWDNGDEQSPDAAVDSDESALAAHENDYGWSVADDSGNRFWPDAGAKTEIEASDDPATTAIAAAKAQRGEWRS